MMSSVNHRDPALNRVDHTTGKISLSVVVPVYNSENSLPELAARLGPVLSDLADQFELIMVNDGSRDRSWHVVEELATRHKWVKGINLMRNYGQHNALLCGIREACFEVIVTMDDDLQHPPEEIPRLLEKLVGGYDVVYGTPQKEQHGLWRNMASWLTKLAFQSIMDAEVARNVSAFRAFRTQLRDAFTVYQSAFVSIDVLLTWATTRFAAIPVSHNPRRTGVSNYTFLKLVIHASNMITGFSMLPLQIASIIGFGFTVFGLLVLAYVIGRYIIEGGSVPGFPFLAAIIAIFSGAQLLVLGIIGEYIARVFSRTMGQPSYTIFSVTDTKR